MTIAQRRRAFLLILRERLRREAATPQFTDAEMREALHSDVLEVGAFFVMEFEAK